MNTYVTEQISEQIEHLLQLYAVALTIGAWYYSKNKLNILENWYINKCFNCTNCINKKINIPA